MGFGHKARQGKDVACQTIVEAFKDRYDIRHYSFGNELKKEVNGLDQFEWCLKLGVQYDINPPMNDPLCQTRHGKQGPLLQKYGTEYRRAQDNFYWVKKLRAMLEAEQPQIALISDVRFPNEMMFCKAFGGFTVKVSRYGYTDLSRDPNHISETALDNAKFDYEIQVLDGELDQLKKDAVTVMGLIISSMNPQHSEDLGDVVKPVEVKDQGQVVSLS